MHSRQLFCFVLISLLGLFSSHQSLLVSQGRINASVLTFTTGDFDEDGLPDLLLARSTANGCALELQRGNPTFRSPWLSTDSALSPFHPAESLTTLPFAPDHLRAGDFDADGHLDLVAGRIGEAVLGWARGTGRGGLKPPTLLPLSGTLTVLQTGEVNRPDGLMDLVLGVTTAQGNVVQVWEGPAGALCHEPEQFSVSQPVTALALGRWGTEIWPGIVAGAGRQLLQIAGRDRRLTTETATQAAVAPAVRIERTLSNNIEDLTFGDFAGTGQTDLAVLLSDGSLQQWNAEASGLSQAESSVLLASAESQQSSSRPRRLVPVRLSSAPKEDCMIVGDLATSLPIWQRSGGVLALPHRKINDQLLSLNTPTVIEALPLRLNEDALSDLIILRAGATAPEFLFTAPTQTFTVTNRASVGAGSFFQAVADAEKSPGMDRIVFNVPGAVPIKLEFGGYLPEIKEAIVIDGTTQPGYQGQPLIGLEGCMSFSSVLELQGGNSVVRGLALSSCRFNTSQGPQDLGAALKLNNAGNNIVEGSYLGLLVDGTCGAPLGSGRCASSCNYEVLITGAANNLIGGRNATARNVLSASNGLAIYIKDTETRIASNNRIEGNLFGTTGKGEATYYSARMVQILSRNNTIGGAEIGAGNQRINVYLQQTSGCLVQGNQDAGLTLDAATGNLIGGTSPTMRNLTGGFQCLTGSQDNLIQGNYIGIQADGVTAQIFDNNAFGSSSLSGSGNLLGGTVTGARNLILNWMRVLGDNNQILGNYIGTNAAGTAAALAPQPTMPPITSFEMITVYGNENRIGGTAANASNLIAGLSYSGIRLVGKGNRVIGNLFGLQSDGVSPLGNQGAAVISNIENFIGGTNSGEGNIIAYNGTGVAGGIIRGNSIYANQGPGIDSSMNGFSANIRNEEHNNGDAHQNAPILSLASLTPNGVRIQGQLNSYANASFDLDFFANTTCHFSGLGEGKTYLGSLRISTGADYIADFAVILPRSLQAGQFITATATRVGGITSEFSPCLIITTGCVGAAPAFDAMSGVVTSTSHPRAGNFLAFEAEGGVLMLKVATSGTCSWTARSNTAWLTLNGTASGIGNGEIQLSAARNPDAASRLATLTIGEQSLQVLQAGRAAIVSAASYRTQDVTNKGILSLFGSNLAPRVQTATSLPLPDSLADTVVLWKNNKRTPLFFVSPSQINFLIPWGETGFGPTEVTVFNPIGSLTRVRFTVENASTNAGAIFSANSSGRGVAAGVALRVTATGAQSYEPIARFDPISQRFIPVPLELGAESEKLYLVLFGTGIPEQLTGAKVGGVTAELIYVGTQGNLQGVDQVNLLLPRTLIGRGLVEVLLENRGNLSNSVQIQIR